MSIRHILRLGAVVGILPLMTACGSAPARKAHPEWNATPTAQQEPADMAQQPGTPAQAGPNGRKVDQMDASTGTVEALTRKTQSYTDEMSPLIMARSGPSPSATPSMVNWQDPPDLKLSPSIATADRGGRGPAVGIAPMGTADPDQIDHAGGQTPLTIDRGGKPAPTAIASAASSPDVMPRVPAPARSATPTSSDALSELLAKRVKEYPRDVSGHLEYQLLQFLKDEPTPQLSDLSSLQPEDREMLTAILDGMSNFRNALRADSNMLFSSKIKPIIEMSERLRNQADLTIPTIRLCTRVQAYGIYDPIEPARFGAGKDEQVIVYCEVANFASGLNDRQMWETRLTWDMTLYSDQGMSVWTDKTETINDVSRNRRHDFFVRKAITVPHTLPIGRYLLKVSIVDTQSNRVAEATTPLLVAAQ